MIIIEKYQSPNIFQLEQLFAQQESAPVKQRF